METLDSAKKARGRPRLFDRERAIEVSLKLFQEHGYEGTSIADLTAALGITATSLYAAFGSKEALFEEAVQLYQRSEEAFAARALNQPGSLVDAIRALLEGAAEHYSVFGRPGGCFVSLGLLSCAVEHLDIAGRMKDRRKAARDSIQTRLDEARNRGELLPATDTKALAGFYAATLQGLSVQARDGATRQELQKIASLAITPLLQSATPPELKLEQERI